VAKRLGHTANRKNKCLCKLAGPPTQAAAMATEQTPKSSSNSNRDSQLVQVLMMNITIATTG